MVQQISDASFVRRGWREWGQNCAARLDPTGGAPTAMVCRVGNGWDGHVEFGRRQLRYLAPTMLTAIARVEWAEAGGFFSPLWRDAPPRPTRPCWEHGVHAGLDYWHAAVERPGWWSLKVELLRDRRYAPSVVVIASTFSRGTSRDYCASYGLNSGPDFGGREFGSLHCWVQYAMDAAERAAQEHMEKYDLPYKFALQPFIPHPASMCAHPPATNMAATDDELARV